MTNSNNQTTITKRLACYDLVQYSQELQQAIKEGYGLCLDTENCPVMIGTLFTCGLLKQAAPTTTSDVKPTNTKGRKPTTLA